MLDCREPELNKLLIYAGYSIDVERIGQLPKRIAIWAMLSPQGYRRNTTWIAQISPSKTTCRSKSYSSPIHITKALLPSTRRIVKMSYLNRQKLDLGADSQADAKLSKEVLRQKLLITERQIAALDVNESIQHGKLQHELAEIYLELGQTQSAWDTARPYFDYYIQNEKWESAVLICDTLFHCEITDLSLTALGHGLWLSITFPIDPAITIAQLQYVIDDTPDDSDGAAVAAAVAAYVVELRGNQNANDDATLLVGQMLSDVARRHSNIQSDDEFNRWFERLELDKPEKFLVRMRNVIDVLVQDQWWIDKNELQSKIPED